MSKQNCENVENKIKFFPKFKHLIGIALSAVFDVMWCYVMILHNMEFGKGTAVLGFLTVFYLVYLFRKEENRNRTYLLLLVSDVLMLMILTANIRRNL